MRAVFHLAAFAHRSGRAAFRAAAARLAPLAALAALLAGGLARSACAQSLAERESAALEHAQVLQLADTESELAAQQLAAARANQGARVALGSALSQGREPITDAVARDY